MTADIVSLAPEPYATWNDGLLAVCEAMGDRHRLPSVLRRLERTAERLKITSEDLCALALTMPVGAPAEPVAASKAAAPKSLATGTVASPQAPSDWGDRLRAGLNAIEAPIRAREQEAEAAFASDDPRRILADTLWGVVATVFVEASDRLGAADPFRRLGARLGLWFFPSSVRRWMGVHLGEDTQGIEAMLRRLLTRFTPEDEPGHAALRLLRITAQVETLPHSAEGIDVLLDIGQAIEGRAARVLQDSLLLAMMDAVGWDQRQALNRADVQLAISLLNRPNEESDAGLGPTASLPAWLREQRHAVLLPDLAWFLPDICFHLTEWPEGKPPEVLEVVVRMLGEQGFAVFPQGPLPLTFYRQFEQRLELPARLADALPEAHDLLRLLSLRDSDWSEAGGEFDPAFWGDPLRPDDGVMDLRTACERAIRRGDPALADMLIGGWLLHALLGGRRALPQVPDIARMIRCIPADDRVSVNAALGLGMAEMTADAEAQRRLSHLLSYLPPILAHEPFEPEADLRAHLGEEQWGWLSLSEQRVLLENERLFRDWRRLRPEDADARGPAKLLPHWAAVFEPLIRRALRRCDRRLALTIHDRMTLGESLNVMWKALNMAYDEQWPEADPRRRHLIGEDWLVMLKDLNRANTQWGKHLAGEGSAPAWHEVAALRSRVIFGGALRRCLEAAGKPTTP